MLERHRALYGQPPRQATADGSSGSRDNLRRAQACGGPRHGLPQEGRPQDRGPGQSRWVDRKLRNLRAGIEDEISCLERADGPARCTWRGLGHFRAYVWSAVMAHNPLRPPQADLMPTTAGTEAERPTPVESAAARLPPTPPASPPGCVASTPRAPQDQHPPRPNRNSKWLINRPLWCALARRQRHRTPSTAPRRP